KLLEDALCWAQVCTLIQPVPLGLADLLRQEFHPQLPPERLERLLILPRTLRTASGVKFFLGVFSIFRAGFFFQWESRRQTEAFRFILSKLKEVEPEQTQSLAHLHWEAIQECVRLGLEPGKALSRLSRLEKTPLGGFIRAELELRVLADQARVRADQSR